MSEKTINSFVWFDLNTTDRAGAKTFYSELFGWSIEDKEMGEAGVYTSLANGENGFGGIDDVAGGAPAHWIGYVEVDDVDARLAKLEGLGGKTTSPGFDIPGVGRMAVLTDSSGAHLALYKGETDSGDWEPRKSEIGDIGWKEVSVNTIEAGKAFYGEGFNWTAGEGMPMATGEYLMLMRGEVPIAGMYQLPEGAKDCSWSFYVNVEDVDATIAKAQSLGGDVIVSEVIEGMVHFALLTDPQGAIIGCAKDLAQG